MEEIYDGMNAGERQLYQLMIHYESEDFKVLPNVLLQKNKEGTNQIDLLVINKKGLFVFEIKDFSGWIFGNEDNSEWTQVFSVGKNRTKKFKFKNPVKQNDNHIKTLKHLLNKNGHYYPIFNVVIFGENATLKDITTSIDVVTIEKAYSVIEKYPEVMISNETIKNIYNLIMEHSLVSSEAMDQHIEYAKSFNQSDTLINAKSDNKTEKTYSKNSNSKTDKSIMPFILFLLTIIISYFIIKIQPWMMLLLIALFVPAKGRRRRIQFNFERNLIIVVVLLLIAIAISTMSSINDLNDNLNTEQSTQPLNTNIQSTSNLNETSESSIFETSETNQISQTNENIAAESTIAVTESYVETTTESSVESTVESTVETSNISVSANNKNTVFLGSNISEVEAILGKPERVINGMWYYQSSYFSVDSNNKIIGWSNNYEQLNSVLSSPKGGIIDLGSDSNEVLNALGSPTEIIASNQYRWSYSNSSILFDGNWKVSGWSNNYNQLQQAMYKSVGGKINLGSSRDTVLEALGAPTEISPTNQNRWSYSNSSVYFDGNWNVTGWSNNYDQLKPAMYQYVGGKIDLGSTREKVLEALGSPTEISPTNQYKWSYSNSSVIFDGNWKVIGWSNNYDQLKPAMYQSVGGKIRVGSSVESVINALGSPTEISSTYPLKWNYQNSFIQFGNDWKVISWKNNYDQLTKVLE